MRNRLPEIKVFLILFFLLVVSQRMCYGQDAFNIKVYNIQTNEPVSFATVRFEGTSRGIVADYYGFFRLPKPLINTISQITITALGYEAISLRLNNLEMGQLNTVKMKPKIESLETVVVDASKRGKLNAAQLANLLGAARKMFAFEIVSKAIDSIPKNLSTRPHSYVGYYREYQFLDKAYYNLNEGVIEQFDNGIDTNLLVDDRNQKACYYFILNSEFERNEDLERSYDSESKYIENAKLLGYGGNEYTILQIHNPIRNFNMNTFSYVYQMNRNFLVNHDFTKGDIQFLEDEPIITIYFHSKSEKDTGYSGYGGREKANQKTPSTFSQSVTQNYASRVSPDHPANGRISISLVDFSIYEFNYTLYDMAKKHVMFNVALEYRKLNSKMYLNFISFNNHFLFMETNVFKEDSILYNKTNNSFKISFNRPVDPKTLKKRNFKVFYKDKRLPVSNVIIENSKTVILQLNEYDMTLTSLKTTDNEDLKILIKGLKDEEGNRIYLQYPLVAYQFREFFVQQINELKNLDSKLQYIDKVMPLKKVPINYLMETEPFIINSPLQKRELQPREDLTKEFKLD